MSTIWQILIALLLVAAVLAVTNELPISPGIKRAIQVVALVAALIWLVRGFAGLTP